MPDATLVPAQCSADSQVMCCTGSRLYTGQAGFLATGHVKEEKAERNRHTQISNLSNFIVHELLEQSLYTHINLSMQILRCLDTHELCTCLCKNDHKYTSIHTRFSGENKST